MLIKNLIQSCGLLSPVLVLVVTILEIDIIVRVRTSMVGLQVSLYHCITVSLYQSYNNLLVRKMKMICIDEEAEQRV